MYKRVDEEQDGELEGFKYTNQMGDDEFVTLNYCGQPIVDIMTSDDNEVSIFINDIPKLVKALQAAYDHDKGL